MQKRDPNIFVYLMSETQITRVVKKYRLSNADERPTFRSALQVLQGGGQRNLSTDRVPRSRRQTEVCFVSLGDGFPVLLPTGVSGMELMLVCASLVMCCSFRIRSLRPLTATPLEKEPRRNARKPLVTPMPSVPQSLATFLLRL